MTPEEAREDMADLLISTDDWDINDVGRHAARRSVGLPTDGRSTMAEKTWEQRMSDTALRDHSQPCEHGFKRGHGWSTPKPGNPPPGFQRYNKGGGDHWRDHHWCDGGRLVEGTAIDWCKTHDRPMLQGIETGPMVCHLLRQNDDHPCRWVQKVIADWPDREER